MCTMEKWLQAERHRHFEAWLWNAGQQPQLLNLVVFRTLFPIGTTAFFATLSVSCNCPRLPDMTQ